MCNIHGASHGINRDERAHTVVDNDYVVGIEPFSCLDSVKNRLLPFPASRDNPPYLGKSMAFDDVFPAVLDLVFRYDNEDVVNKRRFFKNIQSMGQYRFAAQIQVLFVNARSHAFSHSRSGN
jgi:hypothetical protein